MNLEEITEGIWKVEGSEKGSVISFMGGTHGNELTGIECVKRLKDQIEKNELEVISGTLYLILGNPRAIERNTRGAEDHQDLNRRFHIDVLERPSDGTYEDQRAKELAPILQSVDINVDIHSTNKPSEPTILSSVTPKHECVYRWLRADYLLNDPNYVLGGEVVTTDEFVNKNGGLGIAYESGQTTDLTKANVVYEALLNILRDQGVIAGQPSMPPVQSLHYFELSGKIILGEESFRFEEGRGERGFEPFKQGDILAYIGDEPYYAEYDGYIIFPKVKELQKVGKPVVFFAREVSGPQGG